MLTHETIDWLKLVLIPDIGPRRGGELLKKFTSPKNILKAPVNELAEVENVGRGIAQKIIAARQNTDIEKQLKLIAKSGAKVIPLDSPDYPAYLKATFDPPLVIFVKGQILPDDYFSVAIVGTRLASVYGRLMSEKISAQLAQKGITIVSGGARGIDTAAHQAALRSGGRTIAVLGCGVDVAYPLENKKLFAQISQSGALVSEFPLGTEPSRINFPMRNRIISGLSLGVAVIEAPLKSGALITVRHAIEQGREVFSVPADASKFNSQGTNQLIREGAKLVENAEDILEELQEIIRARLKAPKEAKENKAGALPEQSVQQGLGLAPEEEKIYNLLTEESAHIEEIAQKSCFAIGALFNILTRLELKKLIKQLPGKIFAKLED